MFSKTKTPVQHAAEPMPPLPDLHTHQPARAAAAGSLAKTASILAADLTFEGNLIGSGDLHIEGTVVRAT